jgi:hypothetical protein
MRLAHELNGMRFRSCGQSKGVGSERCRDVGRLDEVARAGLTIARVEAELHMFDRYRRFCREGRHGRQADDQVAVYAVRLLLGNSRIPDHPAQRALSLFNDGNRHIAAAGIDTTAGQAELHA